MPAAILADRHPVEHGRRQRRCLLWRRDADNVNRASSASMRIQALVCPNPDVPVEASETLPHGAGKELAPIGRGIKRNHRALVRARLPGRAVPMVNPHGVARIESAAKIGNRPGTLGMLDTSGFRDPMLTTVGRLPKTTS